MLWRTLPSLIFTVLCHSASIVLWRKLAKNGILIKDTGMKNTVVSDAKTEAVRLGLLESKHPTTGLFSLDRVLKATDPTKGLRIGITGCSGGGKTRFARHLYDAWSKHYSVLLEDGDVPNGKLSSAEVQIHRNEHEVIIEVVPATRVQAMREVDALLMPPHRMQSMDIVFAVSREETIESILKVKVIKHRWRSADKFQPFYCELKFVHKKLWEPDCEITEL